MKESPLEAVLPLSPLQEGMLFHALYDGEGVDAYNVQTAVELAGELDAGILRVAYQRLVRRHASLRAGFVHRKSGEPVQVVAREVAVPWQEVDLSGVGEEQRRAELGRLLAGDRLRRFDVGSPPLVRVALVRLAPARHVLVFTHHHILLDGWSLPLVFRELFELYGSGGDDEGLAPVAPYRDYLGWLAAQDRGAAEEAWRQALGGLEAPTLVAPAAEAAVAVAMPERVVVELPEELTSALAAAARCRGLTLNTVVQGAWALLLWVLTGQQDVVFGVTVAGRPPQLPGVEDIVGLLINTVPARVTIDPAEPVGVLLARIQDEQAALTPYQYLGLSDIHRLTSHDRLFDTTVVFQNTPLGGEQITHAAKGLELALIDDASAPAAAHYPLSLVALPGPRLRLEMDFRADLFTRAEAELVAARVESLLGAVAVDMSVPAGRIELVTAAERARLLREWGGAARPIPATTLAELFRAQTERTPDLPALVCDGATLTYAELNARASGHRDHDIRDSQGRGRLPADRP